MRELLTGKLIDKYYYLFLALAFLGTVCGSQLKKYIGNVGFYNYCFWHIFFNFNFGVFFIVTQNFVKESSCANGIGSACYSFYWFGTSE